MGTTERDEIRTGRTTFKLQPAFVLVGAPGIGKRRLANDLAANDFEEKLAVNEATPMMTGVALGLSSDYRTELKIAADRATLLHSTDLPVLYTHSLIDSLAYALARVDIQARYGAGSFRQRETWALTMASIGLMLRDTYKAEETIFLKADFDSDSDQYRVQHMIEAVLEGFEYDHTIIEVDKVESATDDVSRIIEGYIG